MSQPTSNAARNRKFIDKLKLTGNFTAFKHKKAEYEKTRRLRLKESLASLSDSQRTQILSQGRLKSLARVQKHREKKRQVSDTPQDMEPEISSSCVKVEVLDEMIDPLSCESSGREASEQHISSSCSPCDIYVPKSKHTKINFKHSFKTDQELDEAVAKVEKSLPTSPSKRKAVIAKLFYSLDEKSQREIYQNTTTIKRTGHKRISKTLIQEIHKFYQRDDISRLSSNADVLFNFINPSNGHRELLRIRHLMYTLKLAYSIFMKENAGATVSLAKFCSLRPAHVKLCSKDFDVTSMLQVDFTESDAQEDDEPTHRIKKER